MVPPLSLPAPPNPAETSPRLRTLACASGGCPRCDRPVMAAALFCQPGNGDREGGGPAACVDLCARMGGRPAVRRPVSRLPGCRLGRGRGGAGPKEGSVSFWKRRLCLLQYSLRLGSVPLTDPENQTEFSLAVHVCWWASHTGTCAGPRTPPPARVSWTPAPRTHVCGDSLAAVGPSSPQSAVRFPGNSRPWENQRCRCRVCLNVLRLLPTGFVRRLGPRTGCRPYRF